MSKRNLLTLVKEGLQTDDDSSYADDLRWFPPSRLFTGVHSYKFIDKIDIPLTMP